jgi:Mlc titration factor MtfA (ptsG expression regulator)
VRCHRRLSPEHRVRLEALTARFLAEKTFIAHDRLKTTLEMRACVAGNACVLLIGLPDIGVYPQMSEVILYARGFGEDIEATDPSGDPYLIRQRNAGQAWRRGPVQLAWNEVQRSVADEHDGYNVVFHEFAHVLDFFSGSPQAVPLLDKDEAAGWAKVFTEEFDDFREATRLGEPTLLDPYAATNREEFFAVATESFFEQPKRMLGQHPRLYRQFVRLYRQDPANWTSTANLWT